LRDVETLRSTLTGLFTRPFDEPIDDTNFNTTALSTFALQ
jgi:hypothetical protein